MRWVVHGAGAVGGVIGGHLHLAGLPTTLVARGAHLAAIRDGGLRLDTGDGMHRIVAPATDTAAEVEWTDDTVGAARGEVAPGRRGPRRPGRPRPARHDRRLRHQRRRDRGRPPCAASPRRTPCA